MRRITSGELLKHRKGFCVATSYGTTLPGSSRFSLTLPAQSLENYAALLSETGRDAEATKMEARAASIRAKHAERNPAN